MKGIEKLFNYLNNLKNKPRALRPSLIDTSLRVIIDLRHFMEDRGRFLIVSECADTPDKQSLMFVWKKHPEHYLECRILDENRVEYYYRNKLSGEEWSEEMVIGTEMSEELISKVELLTEEDDNSWFENML